MFLRLHRKHIVYQDLGRKLDKKPLNMSNINIPRSKIRVISQIGIGYEYPNNAKQPKKGLVSGQNIRSFYREKQIEKYYSYNTY